MNEGGSERFTHDGILGLLGGGPVSDAVFETLATTATALVAADGGARHAVARGRHLKQVIGDMDSLDADTAEALGRTSRIHDTDQDTTDFEKCLARLTAPVILAAGFIGGRVDHTLAAMSALLVHRDRTVVLLSSDDLVMAPNAPVALDLVPGTRVSIFPMGPVHARSDGLRWPLDGLTLAPDARIATSNAATGPIRIEADGPWLLILPRDALPRLLAAIAASDVRAR